MATALPTPDDTTGLCPTSSDSLPASCRSPQTPACLSFLRQAQRQMACYVRNGMPTGGGLPDYIATGCEIDPSYTAPPRGATPPRNAPAYGG